MRRVSLTATIGLMLAASIQATAQTVQRPSILFNRWEEDWSVLADKNIPREPFDSLKYIPLSALDSRTYLSFGADLRERIEGNSAPNLETIENNSAAYLLSRLEVHADLRIAGQLQGFVQIQSEFAPGKEVLTPVDQNRLDLAQAFIATTQSIGDGTLTLRAGRQQIAFDLQRFVSERDGLNVRQSYDAIWAEYEKDLWLLTSFYSRPVQTQDFRAFDDFSNDRLTYGGFRVERELGPGRLSVALAQYRRQNAKFPSVSGDERRDITDVRYVGDTRSIDWDLEAMYQRGRVSTKSVRAWAAGLRAGYTIQDEGWQPRLGLQIDAASGDRNAHDQRLETFNPLFPNGTYFTLAGYTTYANLVHIKSSVTVMPTPLFSVMLASAVQWRETTADAVYTQPAAPISGTAGRGGRFTGAYGQVHLDYKINPHMAIDLEMVRFDASQTIRKAGGRSANYFECEWRGGW